MNGVTSEGPNAVPASPGQQEQFDLLLGRSREMMGQSGEEWLKALKANPVQAAVTMGTSTVRGIVQMSEKAGQKVDPAVLFHVGIQFIKDIAGIANDAGFVPDDQIDAFLKDVTTQSMMEYLKMDAKDGIVPKEMEGKAAGMLAKMQGQEPAGDPSSPDNTSQHEQAESPDLEQQEGDEEDPQAGLLQQLQRKGV